MSKTARNDARKRPAVVSIVGKSDSGKTTVMEGVIRTLTDKGYRVATVKHHVHDFEIDVPGKDSWRHSRAGAVVTMISSPSKLGVVRAVDKERTLDELVEIAGDVDVVLTEGYRIAALARIEVSRASRSEDLLCTPEELFALVTDSPRDLPGVPTFSFSDTEPLAGLIEARFLDGARPASASAPRSASEGAA